MRRWRLRPRPPPIHGFWKDALLASIWQCVTNEQKARGIRATLKVRQDSACLRGRLLHVIATREKPLTSAALYACRFWTFELVCIQVWKTQGSIQRRLPHYSYARTVIP